VESKKIKIVYNNSRTSVIYAHGTGTGSMTIREIVKDYLLSHRVTYGVAIAAFKVMEEYGLVETDEIIQNGKLYYQFMKLAPRIADEMLLHLNLFGFKPDKRKKPAEEGFDNARHINGNMVYTNYYWTVVYKSKRAVGEAINSMKGKHDSGVDLSYWRETRPDEYLKWVSLASSKERFANDVMVEWAEDEFDPKYSDLVSSIEEDIEERKEVARTMQPRNYGVYPHELLV
jgi:hypothetical protein